MAVVKQSQQSAILFASLSSLSLTRCSLFQNRASTRPIVCCRGSRSMQQEYVMSRIPVAYCNGSLPTENTHAAPHRTAVRHGCFAVTARTIPCIVKLQIKKEIPSPLRTQANHNDTCGNAFCKSRGFAQMRLVIELVCFLIIPSICMVLVQNGNPVFRKCFEAAVCHCATAGKPFHRVHK